jgi:ribulose-phosphate 3-epimerase
VPENRPAIKIAPSILSSDFSRLGDQVEEATRAGADYIHVDVMDGHFVPNITVGAPVVAAVRKRTKTPLDVHLMIENPERYLGDFARAGADIIVVHVETCPHVHRTLQMIKELGVKAGVALNPGTAEDCLDYIVEDTDMVLIMTVNPGFGGQSFIERMLPKIAAVRKRLDALHLNTELEVDGGVGPETAPRVVAAGARVLVAGSAVFTSKHTVAEGIARIRAAL